MRLTAYAWCRSIMENEREQAEDEKKNRRENNNEKAEKYVTFKERTKINAECILYVVLCA